jgi:micrococcal nuclease
MLKKALIILLIVVSGFLYYQISAPYYGGISGNVIKENVFVERVLDGDTIETGIGKVRLLGINTPEKGMAYYDEARIFLQNLVLNESVELQIIEGNEKDKYQRTLGYIFLNEIFVNEKLIANGLANFYSYEDDLYSDRLRSVEDNARKNGLGIWKKSSRFDCVELIELDYEEETRCNDEEEIILENNCGESFEIVIKDNANHIYREVLNEGLWKKSFSCVWNNAGDRLFVWDGDGLVVFESY